MGSSKTKETTNTVTNQTQRAEPTPEERRLNQLTIERVEAAQPGTIEAQGQALNLINALLTGQTLPGYLAGLPGGISPEVTSDISRQAVEDIRPSFQASGIIDSGVAAEISGRVAGDVRRASEEFNIGNLLNLLNLAVGGQAQVQQPLLAQSAGLGGQLAGLRSINTSGTGTSTGITRNPFLTGSDLLSGVGTGIGTFGALR